MDAGSRTTDRARRRGILVAGVGAVAVAAAGGLMIASGASATPAAAPIPAAAAQPALGIGAIWSQTDEATRRALCTSYLADPDGAWQALALVLTAHGADRASTDVLLGRECVAAVTVADLRG